MTSTSPKTQISLGLLTALFFMTGLLATAAEDPLEPIAASMNGAAAGLDQADVGKKTQKSEEEAIAQLKTLIEKVEEQLKQCQSCKKPGGPTATPNKGLEESKITQGPGGRGQMITGREGANDWAKLPDRDRDRIIQAREDGFPAGYEALLERYYRRLAEGKAANDPLPEKPE